MARLDDGHIRSGAGTSRTSKAAAGSTVYISTSVSRQEVSISKYFHLWIGISVESCTRPRRPEDGQKFWAVLAPSDRLRPTPVRHGDAL